MISITTLEFLKKLKSNNNKEWFDKNRKEYESAKAEMKKLCDAIINEVGKFDKNIAGLESKNCLFRINRDIRFSKDKSPYKTNMGAYFSKHGKNNGVGGYYFHLEPGKSFIGGGMYGAMPEQLKAVRQEIDYNLSDFKKIISSSTFKKMYPDLEGEKLKNAPKGYEESNPAVDFLKHKNMYVSSAFSDEELMDENFNKSFAVKAKVLYPFLQFFDTAISNE
ncbi:MAG: hypothetical protein RL065_2165 [Bacteroidota bacterium]|jgi:uncharacterized protein (TIGR02453 family)